MSMVLYFRGDGLVKIRMPLDDEIMERYGKPIYGGRFGFGEWAMIATQYPFSNLPELRYLVVHARSGFPITEWFETKREALQRARFVLKLLPPSDLLPFIQESSASVAAIDQKLKERDSEKAVERSKLAETADRRAGAGYVYLIRCDDRYKIGKALNVQVRLKAMMLPSKPEIVATGHFEKPYTVERELHRTYKHCRENGEWFRLTTEEVEAVKARLAQQAVTQ